MKSKKNLIAGAIAAGIAPAAYADIELGSGFSITGFADMSYTNSETSTSGSPSSTARGFGIDQFETDFLFSGSNGVSAQVDIEYGESSAGGPGDDDTFVEQAFVTKSFNDKFSMKVGRFLSYSGWETEEPTGLFQYSTVGGGYQSNFYGYYQQGVSAYYDGGTVDFMASVVTSAFDPLERDTTHLNSEIGIAISPSDAFTAKLFLMEDSDDDLVNFWTSYKVGNMTFAFEYNTRDYDAGGEGKGYLLMANYASGNFGITVRYHDYEFETAGGVTFGETDGITLSPSYKVGDNLLLVAEYRMDTFKGTPDTDVDTLALEALFMF